jgi:CDP-diacylglycerol--inositol 3-phosphatidyltransferase
MAGAKNRRQGSAAASPEPKEQDKQINGNGSAHAEARDVADGPQENIFLLWPNIIGKECRETSPENAC